VRRRRDQFAEPFLRRRSKLYADGRESVTADVVAGLRAPPYCEVSAVTKRPLPTNGPRVDRCAPEQRFLAMRLAELLPTSRR
jgi:hypothetical protein